MRFKTPKLKKIDLGKRNKCNHPDIKLGKEYLALVQLHHSEKYYCGKFSKQWYGLNFQAVYGAGLQLDSNSFLALWEIG